jgi:hypothetical protein
MNELLFTISNLRKGNRNAKDRGGGGGVKGKKSEK